MTSVGLGADPGFLAVSPQLTFVINLVVGCHYLPPGLQLLSRPKRSPRAWYQIIWLGDRGIQV